MQGRSNFRNWRRIDLSAPPELVEVAVARYGCAPCGCSETREIKVGEVWEPVGPAAFCAALAEYNAQRGDCLTIWHTDCC